MDKCDFENEHVHLVKLLRNSTQEQRNEEADEQEAELNEQQKELKKAVLMHMLDGDLRRIEEIRQNYPVQEFMNLFLKQDTAQIIDLDYLFRPKPQKPLFT